ncbi:MAG: hypothetical protein PHO02_06265 [Candidatus Nanoarchaeia archaeon]|nr:hypothetical protein [Candidatus Nanoarchaeia archaeon]MDI6737802.1 hypothetical protein [Nanoarchaeota archaeon]
MRGNEEQIKFMVKTIISRLTQNSPSVFYEQVFYEAGDVGIGDSAVKNVISELKKENYLEEFLEQGVLRRLA